ncbi:aromatic ring-hydroxylating oxygenase subunit alpha [Parvularcula marina]|uniref:3-phenylpropionate dioxygenase n=1 Tax=Parvularcula marina TaxID=2292771 RepID=A0A371RLG4_9PROT|nr:Rieske 2Fe-2S domain-containing protein [Parvularcula marina]RFB06261.1 3-phenylpropionate dioxygenase [Parvularcula marina]
MSSTIASEEKDRTWPELGACRVPAWVYSDPDLFKRELETFHYGPTWSFIGLECEVAEPKSFRRTFVGTRSVLITRDAEGEIHVVENRCAHRGSPLCWEQHGKAEDLTCPYHQWTYDFAGNLQGVPFMRGAPRPNPGMPRDFKKSENGLRKLRTHIHNGTVWATYSDETPPFEEYVGPEILKLITRVFNGRELRLLGYSRQMIPCNWKLYFENSRDPYHATLLHSFFTTFGIYRADAKFMVSPQPNGHEFIYSVLDPTLREKRSEVTDEMKTLKDQFTLHDMDVVSPVDEFEDGLISSLQVFPSIFVQQHGNVLALRHILPKETGKTELGWIYFGYADDDEEMQSRRLKQGNLVGPAGYVSLEDSEVLAQVQGVATSTPDSIQVVEMGGRDNFEPSETAITENLIRSFYKFYREKMGF